MNMIKRFMLAIMLAVPISIVASQSADASITRFPNGVSSFGVPILPGISNSVYSGDVFWVDSGDSGAADGGGGGSKEQPFKTIDFAVGQCTANNGDLILVMPGHVETVTAAAGLDLDVAGITVLGLGEGADRPVVRFTTATTADMDFDAASVKVINILFESRIDSLLAPIDINAADCQLLNIETRDVASLGSTTNFIVTDANADRLLIDGWRHIGTSTNTFAANPYSALSLTGGDDIVIKNFNIYGNFEGSGIIATVTGCTRINISGGGDMSYIWTENATDSAISALTSTGWMGPNIAGMVADNAANLTGIFSGGSMQFVSPLPVVNLAGEQTATTTNITASTDE